MTVKAANAIMVAEAAQVPAPTTESAAIIQMIERAARDPNVDIVKMERLFEMHQSVLKRNAEAAFNTAMAEAQAELVPVAKNQTNKQTGSKYADIAAISEAAMPTVHKHGFGLIFSEFKSERPDHMGVACTVTHAGGHSTRHEFNVPVDGTGMKGNPNKTATHAYGSTFMYGRRYATCGVFNIVTKEDDDGNAAGAPEFITDEQAQQIRDQIDALGVDIEKFFAWLNVDGIAKIPAKRFQSALDALDAKRRASL